MKLREDVVQLIYSQLNNDNDNFYKLKNNRGHYGLAELRQLLDFIYEQEPQKENEYILNTDEKYCTKF